MNKSEWLDYTRKEYDSYLLRLFGDSLDHTTDEIFQQSFLLGAHRKMGQKEFYRYFKDVLLRNLVQTGLVKETYREVITKSLGCGIEMTTDDFTKRKYRLSRRGDEKLRGMMMRRGGEEDYYRLFKRPQLFQPVA